MEFQKYKCSLEAHKVINATKYCGECNTYFCNKCESYHSEIFQKHHVFQLDKDINELFTGFCKEKNHKNELYYFCKDHNILCCAECIAKIKTEKMASIMIAMYVILTIFAKIKRKIYLIILKN